MNTFRKMTIGCVVFLCASLIFSACGGDSSDDITSVADNHTIGAPSPFSFSSKLENQKLELTITQNHPILDEYGNEYQNFVASMYFADDAGNLLKLSGGEYQTFEKDQKYVMTVEFESDANFVYAALRAQVYHGSECELIQLTDSYATFLFKNNEGNVRIIDVNEYYAHSASQEGN